jgi:ABC-type lipoprotein release transport system permease subunit
MVEGTYLTKLGDDEIIIGNEISGTYDPIFKNDSLGGVHVGDYIDVTFINGISEKFRVKGIYNTKLVTSDSRVLINKNF